MDFLYFKYWLIFHIPRRPNKTIVPVDFVTHLVLGTVGRNMINPSDWADGQEKVPGFQ